MATKRWILLFSGFALFFLSLSLMKATESTATSQSAEPTVERLDPAANAILPAKPIFQKFGTQSHWTEGPIWIPAGYLLFADIPSNNILKLNADGAITVFMHPSGYEGSAPYGGPETGSNGMTLDRRGRLTVAGHARRNVWRLESMDPKGPITVLADTYQGKQLNSPNDLVYKSDGSLYFSDPPYGLRTQSDNDPHKELPFNGVYRIRNAFRQKPGTPPIHENLELLVKDLPRPNGLAFSPDEKYLYVDNSEPRKFWMRYPVKSDGTLGEGKIFFDASSDTSPGAPDGMKVDQAGNVYSAGPGGVWIFSPAGKHLATIHFPERVGNLNWGGVNGRILYVAATNNIYRVTLKIRGVRPQVR